ncbi:hypothetical protein ACO22_00512 [Paracoccidioides brasiliensis]|uniref:Uncharacterized protein n=1 Tax=Paracoccidioides brasiliensis TaxID=121759 RepID=A0A1D2JPB1_PARBR|nr:hypothetical protein ACO22_00512 [Paracoccidioides brasiliensis]
MSVKTNPALAASVIQNQKLNLSEQLLSYGFTCAENLLAYIVIDPPNFGSRPWRRTTSTTPSSTPRGSIVASSGIATNHHICCVWSRLVDRGAEDSPPSKVTAQSCQTLEFLGQLLERRTEAAPHERQNKVRTTPVELGLIPLMAVGGDVKGSG